MDEEQNFGSEAKVWVGSKILSREQNFGSGAKFWVGSKILGQERNCGLGAKGAITFSKLKKKLK